MDAIRSLIGGTAGAAALTLVHQTARQVAEHAPRVDVIGRRGIARSLRALGFRPPRGQRLQRLALTGDLVSNSACYALLELSSPRHLWRNAWVLGLGAGIAAVVLPPILGLGAKPTSRTAATAGMTIAWYTLGALAAAGTIRAMRAR